MTQMLDNLHLPGNMRTIYDNFNIKNFHTEEIRLVPK
jgi:hypothetical protein